jgi:hypothetical protein
VTTRPTLILLALAALALPGAATAQGLGDAAAREKAKREAAKKAGETKVFTNQDLHEDQAGTPAATPATASSESARPAAEGAQRESDPDAEDRPAEGTGQRVQEQQYLEAMAAAQSRVTELEGRIKELQAKLNPMSTTYIYGDFNGLGGDKVAEETQVKSGLAQAEGELNTARQALVDATRAVQEVRQGRPASPPVDR